jgi:hypothetical protein
MQDLLSGNLCCLVESWSYIGMRRLKVNIGGINISLGIDDPLGLRLDTWGVEISF